MRASVEIPSVEIPSVEIQPVEIQPVSHPLRHRRARWALLVALAIELVGIAWLVLSPSSAAPDAVTVALSELLTRAGAPGVVADQAFIEFVLNVALFVPLGVTLALLLPQVRWWVWALMGLVMSAVIEGAQLLFLSARSATVWDVVANAAGLAIGALLVAAALQLARRRRSAEIRTEATV